MIDCTHDNVQAVHARFPNADMVAWYGTGSPGIDWTPADRLLWPHAVMVEIDQGGAHTPQLNAPIRDVENGAWTIGNAVKTAGWTAPVPTIYCARNTLPSLHAEGWRGAVWLAWPGFAGTTPPDISPAHCVAVQNVFGDIYDSSIVFDDAWPGTSTVTPSPTDISVTVFERHGHCAFPSLAGTDHYVINYRASATAPEVLITRIPGDSQPAMIHTPVLTIPGAHGGTLTVYAIIHGAAHIVGAKNLP